MTQEKEGKYRGEGSKEGEEEEDGSKEM